MGVIESVIGAGMMIGALVGAGKKGIEANSTKQQLDQQASDLSKKIEEYKQKWNAVIVAEYKITQEISDELIADQQIITSLSKQLRASKDLHAAQYRTIQIFGLVLVATFIILLIEKSFGITEITEDVLEAPFEKIFSTKKSTIVTPSTQQTPLIHYNSKTPKSTIKSVYSRRSNRKSR